MAEDKRIRVSADLSQLRSLREEASSMYREIIGFNEVYEKLNEQAISQLREQLNLLKDRNDLEELFGELKKKNSLINYSISQGNNTPSNQDSTASQSQIREEVDESVVNKRKEEINENITNINRNVENIQETTSVLRTETVEHQTIPPTSNEKDTVSENRRKQISNSVDEDSSEKRELADVFRQAISDLGSKYVTGFDLESRILRNLIQKQNITNRALNSVVDILISIDENIATRENIQPSQPSIIPTPIPEPRETEPSQPPREIVRETREPRQENTGWNRATNIGTRIISGVGAAVGQSPVSMAGSIISGLGGIAGEGLGMIPGIGGFLGGMATAAANVYAGIFTASIEKAFEAQRRAVGWSQTMGISNNEAMGVASREGGYAASALGMNIGQYIERRNSLLRASGGKFLGATSDDSTGRQEAQSLMAVERLYGLNPQSINSLQGSMRFARRDGESTDSASSIIRIFEQTMRRLQLPFSEIASTMEESLSTFTKTADDILSKAGDFDSSRVAAVLAGVRAYTGMEGKQLERVQQAISGTTISQDQVTQAFLLRAVTKLDSSVKTYSDAQAKIETIAENPELMKEFIQDLRNSTQSQEQFINVLHTAFTNLSYHDIKDLLEKGPDLKPLFDKILELEGKTKKENESINRYEPTAAKETVSTGEAMMSAYENKMIGIGSTNQLTLNKIFTSIYNIEDFLKNFKPESYTDKLGDLIKENKGRIAANAASLIPGVGTSIQMIAAVVDIVDRLKKED